MEDVGVLGGMLVPPSLSHFNHTLSLLYTTLQKKFPQLSVPYLVKTVSP